MKNRALIWVIVVAVAVLLVGVTFLIYFRAGLAPSPTKTAVATSEAKAVLPRVITLYQKGEGESDLALFVSNELARGERGLAVFRAVNILDEPQMAEFYGVSSMPTIVFVTVSGQVYRKHSGYLDKKVILATLKSMAKR